jgi:hypothetical protein
MAKIRLTLRTGGIPGLAARRLFANFMAGRANPHGAVMAPCPFMAATTQGNKGSAICSTSF